MPFSRAASCHLMNASQARQHAKLLLNQRILLLLQGALPMPVLCNLFPVK